MILASNIGSQCGIKNWPTSDIDGLFDALKRWQLDTRLDLSADPAYEGRPGCAPFRGLAFGHCVAQYVPKLDRRIYIGTKAIYPDHPDAVRYVGNFIGYSFGFWLDTDDMELINRLDQAISENLAAQVYRS
jgi:hypothetical protein